MIYNYKKSVLFVFACWVCCTGIGAQSSEQNYIRTRTMLNEAGTQSLDFNPCSPGSGSYREDYWQSVGNL